MLLIIFIYYCIRIYLFAENRKTKGEAEELN